MFCIKCFHPHTQVINSRPHKKAPGVWRRRKCSNCGIVFTTDEQPRLRDSQRVWHASSGTEEPFNPGILLMSIANSFGHDPRHGATVSWDLMQTVTQQLAVEFPESLSSDDIAATTHQIIDRFDNQAGLQYGLQHSLLTQKTIQKRRR